MNTFTLGQEVAIVSYRGRVEAYGHVTKLSDKTLEVSYERDFDGGTRSEKISRKFLRNGGVETKSRYAAWSSFSGDRYYRSRLSHNDPNTLRAQNKLKRDREACATELAKINPSIWGPQRYYTKEGLLEKIAEIEAHLTEARRLAEALSE